MSQSVIHYNHYQSKDSVNCEHTLGDKKNALFTVQRFPRGILVDWLVLRLDHNFANTFQFSQFLKKKQSLNIIFKIYFSEERMHIAQGQLDVAQRFISFHSYVSPKQNQLKPAKQDKMHYFDFSSN